MEINWFVAAGCFAAGMLAGSVVTAIVIALVMKSPDLRDTKLPKGH